MWVAHLLAGVLWHADKPWGAEGHCSPSSLCQCGHHSDVPEHHSIHLLHARQEWSSHVSGSILPPGAQRAGQQETDVFTAHVLCLWVVLLW